MPKGWSSKDGVQSLSQEELLVHLVGVGTGHGFRRRDLSWASREGFRAREREASRTEPKVSSLGDLRGRLIQQGQSVEANAHGPCSRAGQLSESWVSPSLKG